MVARIERHVLPAMTVLPFEGECARVFGKVRALLRKAGTPIDDMDGMIAGTAVLHGLTIVTANVSHFERVPGLEVRPFSPGAQQ